MTIPSELLQQCWFLAGPTAVGKTATSLQLARQLNAEILSLDSMAIYRRMDIGTAKPTAVEQQQTRHHLIDLIEPHEDFSTADYLIAAEAAVRDVLSRGKVPLFAGGTGLYLRSLLRGVFSGPSADWALRKQLEEQERNQPGSLWQRLQTVDPASANRLHENDQRRIIRALEVQEMTGQPLSELHQQQAALPVEQRPANVYWLHPPREWLAERINRRVEQMLAQGLVAEVESLLQRNPPLGQTARQGLGYKEVIEYLDQRCNFDEMTEKIQVRTRQFAKRQHTWFRNLEECREVKLTGSETSDDICGLILKAGMAGPA